MKTQLLSGTAAIALLFSSCAHDDGDLADRIAIHFNGKINELVATNNTGALSTVWSPNDQIGLFVVDNKTNTITEDNSNRQYTFSGNQFSPIAGNEIYYPVSDTKVDFIAYFPFEVGYTLTTPINLNVANQMDLSQIDFLYAKSDNAGEGFNKTLGRNVPLTFDHKLTKLNIKPTAGSGLSASDTSWTKMTVNIQGLNTMCSFNLATGELGTPSTPSTITPFVRTAGVSYEAIIIPEVYPTEGSVIFNFKIGRDTYELRSQANETFEAGKEYTYTVRIDKTGLVLDNVTIKDWVSVSRSGIAN